MLTQPHSLTITSQEPFPYIVTNNVFYVSEYRRLLKALPETAKMHSRNEYARQMDIIPDPGEAEFADGSCDYHHTPLTNSQIEFWDEFKEEVLNPNGGFVNRLKSALWIDEPVIPIARYTVDFRDSGLGPHMDRADKLASVIIYLTHVAGAAGTALLKPKDPKIKRDARHYSFEDFTFVGEIPFWPNRMVAWAVGDGSWHAFHQRNAVERPTIKMFLLRPSDWDAVQATVKESKQYASDWRAGVKPRKGHRKKK